MIKRKFSLIELLVVVAIIGILASFLLPALAKARLKSTELICTNNLKTLGVACFNFADNEDGEMPQNEPNVLNRGNGSIWVNSGWYGLGRLYDQEYISVGEVYYCSVEDSDDLGVDASRGFNNQNGWIDTSYFYRKTYNAVDQKPPSATDPGTLSLVADHFSWPWNNDYNHSNYRYNVLYLDGSVSYQVSTIAQTAIISHYDWDGHENFVWKIFDR